MSEATKNGRPAAVVNSSYDGVLDVDQRYSFDVSSRYYKTTVTVKAPPEVDTSAGSADYVEFRVPVVVDPGLNLTYSGTIDGVEVSIDDGVRDGDVLSYNSSLASGYGISGGYDATTGVLSLSGGATAAEYQEVLRTVTFENTNEDPATHDRTITVNLGQNSLYFEGTGHYYEYVSDPGITWTNASEQARAMDHFGLQGYLVTVTSAEENAYARAKLGGSGWMGPDASAFSVESAPTLVVETNDTQSPTGIDLSGEAVAAKVAANPRTANFDDVAVNETAHIRISVTNQRTSKTDLHVDRTTITGQNPQAFDVAAGDAPFALRPGQTRYINLSYTPRSKGVKNAQLQILSDAGNEPQITVWLSSTEAYIVVQEVHTVQQADDAIVNVDGNNVANGSNLLVNVSQPGTRAQLVGVDTLSMTVRNESHFDINTTHSRHSPGANTWTGTDDQVVQYVALDHSVADAGETYDDTALTYRVNKTSLPAVTNASDVTVRRYKESEGAWNVMPVTLRSESTTHYFYAADTPGFSQFVVTAPKPASASPAETGVTGGGGGGGGGWVPASTVELQGVTLSADTVGLGEPVEISAPIANTRLGRTTYTAELIIDGTVVETRDVRIAGGEQREVVFTHRFYEPGAYSVRTGDREVGPIIVQREQAETPTPTTTIATPETPSDSGTGDQSPDATQEALDAPTQTLGSDATAGGTPWSVLGSGFVIGLLALLLVAGKRRRNDDGE